MSIFDEQFEGLEKAATYERGQFMLPGTYTLKISAVKLIKSTKDEGRYFFVVEFLILTSSVAERPAGASVTWMVDMSKKQTALPNVKGFLKGIFPDVTKEQEDTVFTPRLIEKLCSEDQPCAEVNVEAEAIIIQTRAGNDFTKIRWKAFTDKAATAQPASA